MATVSHGSPGHFADQMHPFFRSAHGISPRADTTTESISKATTPETSIAPRPEDARLPSPSTSESGEEARSTYAKDPKIGVYDGVQETEMDLKQHRRKRRKITPGFQNRPDSLNPAEDNSEISVTWRHQLEEAANMVNDGTDATITCESSSTVETEHPAVSSPRRSSRISISQMLNPEATNDPPVRPSALLETSKLGGTDKIRDLQHPPQKKKMLKLTNKGKLLSSPTTSPETHRTKNLSAENSGQISLHRGRLAPSLKIAIPYKDGKSEIIQIAEKIDRIMKGDLRVCAMRHLATSDTVSKGKVSECSKPTHPFFKGKATLKDQTRTTSTPTEQSTTDTPSEGSTVSTRQPVPWSQIKFSKLSHQKDPETQPPLWPPVALQHVQPLQTLFHNPAILPHSARGAKQKRDLVQVSEDQDILRSYTNALLKNMGPSPDIQLPERLCLDNEMLSELLERDCEHDHTSKESKIALQKMKARALANRSAFDQGKAAGPQDWAHAYSPKRADEALQPQAVVLHDWLTKLKVHHVQSKLSEKRDPPQTRRAGRKRKPKREDGMDDFIASSDDEATSKSKSVKNVVILCGPSGTGKTASVYAVAQELEFEVFEIHPGMRRTSRDIFDKVGDMAHNHLVHPSTAMSRDSSTLTEGIDQLSAGEDIASGKQFTMGSFFAGRQNATVRPATPPSEKPNLQKQSLILFEEVDILFEEDKSFWSGVQALIQQSKRPIVLTCNSLDSVPTDELDIHTTLSFGRASPVDVVEYLVHVAASEGHLLSREDVETLSLGRGQDLRATLMELNFWCQMTVGSKLGGLDWMQYGTPTQSKNSRIISKGTYYRGLNLLPERKLAQQDLLSFAEESFDLSPLDWEEMQYRDLASQANKCDRWTGLEDFLALAEVKSCMDIFHVTAGPLMSTVATAAYSRVRRPVHPEDLLDSLLSRPNDRRLSCNELTDIFQPLMEDFRTFPPTTGRAAATFDGASQSVATEVAPYIRSIVAFDQRLEEQRNALFGRSELSRQRKTRAARAALEGSDKANTRRETWFPRNLDFERVLKTMPGWAYETLAESLLPSSESLPSSQDTVSDDGVNLSTPDALEDAMYVDKGTHLR